MRFEDRTDIRCVDRLTGSAEESSDDEFDVRAISPRNFKPKSKSTYDKPSIDSAHNSGKFRNLEGRITNIEKKVDLVIDTLAKLTTQQGKQHVKRISQRAPLTCFSCGEIGHFRDKCPRLKYGEASVSQIQTDEDADVSLNDSGSDSEA